MGLQIPPSTPRWGQSSAEAAVPGQAGPVSPWRAASRVSNARAEEEDGVRENTVTTCIGCLWLKPAERKSLPRNPVQKVILL